jgi:hypothetical protein
LDSAHSLVDGHSARALSDSAFGGARKRTTLATIEPFDRKTNLEFKVRNAA